MELEDRLIVEALKIDWAHARHVENLRLNLTTVYIISVLGTGLAALKSEEYAVRLGASVLGLLITVFCWAMTYKWNKEFAHQIKSADKCAQRLIISPLLSNGQETLHSYIGFPIRGRYLFKIISVRLMFFLFYLLFFLVWLAVLYFVCKSRTEGWQDTIFNLTIRSR